MKNAIFYAQCILFVLGLSCSPSKKEEVTTMTYTPDFESLATYNEQPEWFQDAKFGIYFHWGVYSVPAFGSEWYPRNMHFPDDITYHHHVTKYGHPSEFGYHDFVPMFKAENFDAVAWADLFKKAGAKFAGPVAEHHDGYAMWASKITPWNSLETGPHRDILGELATAIRAQDMKLIATFHHERNLQRYDSVSVDGRRAYNNSHFPYFKGMPPSSNDEKLQYMYGNLPEDFWLEKVWLGKLKEVIDNYHPDIIWFDSWLDLIPEQKRNEFGAYYFNDAVTQDKEVVVVRKQEDLPLEWSVNDLEKSRMNRTGEKSWMTDETISYGSWCYTENLEIKPAKDLIHILVDIVSKNGVLLLNISPKADGTIPEDQRQALIAMGEWLQTNGEAIYGTRPWITFGEGPTKEPEGNFKNHAQFQRLTYTSNDMRYTSNGNVVYATIFGLPGEKTVLLQTFARTKLQGDLNVTNVSILGLNEKIDWEMTDEGLRIVLPANIADSPAIVFKLDTEGSASLVE